METFLSVAERDPVAVVATMGQAVYVYNFAEALVCKSFATQEMVSCMCGFDPLFTGHGGMKTGYARFVRWNIKSGTVTFEKVVGQTPLWDIEHIAYCKKRSVVCTGHVDGNVRVWCAGTGEFRYHLCTGHDRVGGWGSVNWQTLGHDRLKLMAFDDGRNSRDEFLFVVHVDGSLEAWDVAGRKRLFKSDGACAQSTVHDDEHHENGQEDHHDEEAWKHAVVDTFGETLLKQGGAEVSTVEALTGKTLIAVYFGAKWCPHCPPFSKELKDFYANYKDVDPGLEIVFASGDRDQDTAEEYFAGHHGDWLMMPYCKEKYRSLENDYGVEGIPTLVTLTPEGKVLNNEADEVLRSGTSAEDAAKQGLLKKKATHPDMFEASIADRGLSPSNVQGLTCIAFGCDAFYTGHAGSERQGVCKRGKKKGKVVANRDSPGVTILTKPNESDELYAATDEKTVICLDADLDILKTFDHFGAAINCLRYEAKLDDVIGGTANGRVFLLNAHDDVPVPMLHKPDESTGAPICAIAPAADGWLAVVDQATGFFAVQLDSAFDDEEEATHKEWVAPKPKPFKLMRHSADGNLAVTTNAAGEVQLWSTDTCKQVYDLSTGEKDIDAVEHCGKNDHLYVAASSQGAGGWRSRLFVVDLRNFENAEGEDHVETKPIKDEWLCGGEPVDLGAGYALSVAVCCARDEAYILAVEMAGREPKITLTCVQSSGKERWKKNLPRKNWSELDLGHVDGSKEECDRLVGVASDGDVYCWSCSDGQKLWDTTIPRVNNLVTLKVWQNAVFVMCDHGSLTRMSLLDGDRKFHNIHDGDPRLRDQAGRTWGGEKSYVELQNPFFLSGQIIHMRVWSMDTGEILDQKDDLDSWVTSISLCRRDPDQQHDAEADSVHFFTGHRDGNIYLWEFGHTSKKITQQWVVRYHTSQILGLSSKWSNCAKRSQLWSLSSIKLMAMHEDPLKEHQIVSLRELGASSLTNQQTAWINGYMNFIKQVVIVITTFLQLAAFVYNNNTSGKLEKLKEVKYVATGLQTVGLDWITCTFTKIFFACVAAQCVFIGMIYAQEAVEWKQLVDPENKLFHNMFLACSLLCVLMVGPMVLPIYKYLMFALICTDGHLKAQEDVACWTPFHIWAMVLPAVVLMVVGYVIILRVHRCGGQLNRVEMVPNPFDSSGDAPMDMNRPRWHRLAIKFPHYEVSLLNIKLFFLVATWWFISPWAISICYVLGALVLVVTNFTIDLYWEDVIVCCLRPTCLQAGLDIGLLCLYLGSLASNISSESAPESSHWVPLVVAVCCTPFFIVGGYFLRKRYLGKPPFAQRFGVRGYEAQTLPVDKGGDTGSDEDEDDEGDAEDGDDSDSQTDDGEGKSCLLGERCR